MEDLDLRSNLKRILREKSMSQLELARQLNISPTNLNTRLARGRNCQLSLVESICNALSVQVGELLYGDATIAIETEKPQTGDTMIEDCLYRKHPIKKSKDSGASVTFGLNFNYAAKSWICFKTRAVRTTPCGKHCLHAARIISSQGDVSV